MSDDETHKNWPNSSCTCKKKTFILTGSDVHLASKVEIITLFHFNFTKSLKLEVNIPRQNAPLETGRKALVSLY